MYARLDVIVLGGFILAMGVAMPEQTTDTLYRNGEVIEKVWVNQYKTPVTVVGGAILILGFVLSQDESSSA